MIVLLLSPGWLLSYHLVDCASQTPYVSEPVMPALLDDFGRHPVRSSTETLGICILIVFDDLL